MNKAEEFYEAGVVLEGDSPSASVELLVLAGIAAADVVCCVRLGMHSSSESHREAVALLEKAEPHVEKHLGTLLGLKSKVAYTHLPPSTDDCKKASRTAENLVEAARRIAKPPKSKE
jgi:hypothetical protein